MARIETINPASGETLKTYEEYDDEQLAYRLARAWSFYVDVWGQTSVDERVKFLSSAADVLDRRRDEFAQLITQEMGKPIVASRSEIEKCAWLCRHYVERAAQYLQPEEIGSEADRSYVRFDPLGPILAIMPWNFPFWQAFRFAVPNLAAGNVGLLKHSSNTTGCGVAIEEVFAQAGLPEGGFQTLVIGHGKAAELMADPRIRGVTITGSDRAGRSVASTAGQHLKKTVLELGGSDPCIVLEDADLDEAAKVACQSRYLNSGQSCINAKRIIVLREVYEEFLERFRGEVERLTVGDPMEEGTDVGPLAREDLRDSVHDQVARTLQHQDGGTLVLGGEPLDRAGYYYAPTIIRDVNAEAPAAQEEVFGPVAALMDAQSEEVAIALANSSRFGLGASLWTSDLERGERLAGRIESGMVFINELTKSDPRLPFGGMKDSGYGRELAHEGAREFTNHKTVWLNRPTTAQGGLVE
ncbi:MAG: NAD-dependent succinate-semialdehyde dehydrogenase [Nitriliruptorales bacterium]